MKTIFLRVVGQRDKARELGDILAGDKPGHFEVDVEDLQDIPGSPLAYWVTPGIRGVFRHHARFGSNERFARQGLATADDFRFVRAWTELSSADLGRSWFTFVRGGSTPFHTDLPVVVGWVDDGHEMKAWAGSLYGKSHWSRILKNTHLHFVPGITFPRRPHRRAWFALVPRDTILSVNGPMIFAEPGELLALVAFLNSRVFNYLIQLLMARGHGTSGQTLTYEVGMVESSPMPDIGEAEGAELADLARGAWRNVRSQEASRERSRGFLLPLPVAEDGGTLAKRSRTALQRVHRAQSELLATEARIDDLCFDLYGIDEADRRAITEGLGEAAAEEGDDNIPGDRDDDASVETSAADPAALTADLLSWCVGVAFGRFDIRLATGEREAPPEPDPFDPLPVCSPGMLTGEDGLPLASPPGGYPIAWPEDGVLVDDPGHPRDLTAAVREVFEVVFGADADAFWTEAAELVDLKGQDIRRWLQKTYFAEHIKRYSKSRRKAPIYWQLATPSASYSVWLYAHRIGRDSLYQVLNDFVSPKLQAEERKLHALVQEHGPNPTAAQRKELDAQESVVSELRVLREEVARVAPLWNPDLNDGVVIVTAPLWRLVPQLKSWQKELKTHWDSLCAGRYDWARLAMHLWPERVVPKCAEDRSLAIAHDLEDVFWEQNAEGKWSARKEPTRSIDELVAERSSPAVKDALETLLPGSKVGRSMDGATEW